MKKILQSDIGRLLIILVAFLLLAGITHPSKFYNVSSFQAMGKQLSEYGLMAIGVAIAMISGGIDLSTVYIANLSGIMAAKFMSEWYPGGTMLAILGGVAIGLLTGAICGAFNGFLIAQLKVPPMLATLGTFQLFMGIAIVISHGRSVGGVPEQFSDLSRTLLFKSIPLSFFVFFLTIAVMAFVMSKTVFGQRVYLVGTNMKAARFVGIKTKRILIETYMISGLISGLAGILSLARISSAKADFGSSYTMQSILIVVLGGVSPNGGFGKIQGVGIAVIILQMISSYLNLFPKVSNYYRDLIWGVALIGVLVLNVVLNRMKTKRLTRISTQDTQTQS